MSIASWLFVTTTFLAVPARPVIQAAFPATFISASVDIPAQGRGAGGAFRYWFGERVGVNVSTSSSRCTSI